MINRILAVTLCVVLGACSSYQGGRLPPDGALPKGERPSGLPFTLTRPQYIVEKDDKGVTKVVVTYVPDPEQRFTLRMNPALLANVGFRTTYGENGAITGLTGSSVEQLSPTIIALTKATGSIAGAQAAAVLADQGDKALDNLECLSKETNYEVAVCALDKLASHKTCPATDVAALKERMARVVALTTPDKADALGALYAFGSGEQDCLSSASTELESSLKAVMSATETDTNKAFRAALGKAFDEQIATVDQADRTSRGFDDEVANARDALFKAVGALDAEKIRRIDAAITRFDGPPSQARFLEREIRCTAERTFSVCPDGSPEKPWPAGWDKQNKVIAGAVKAALFAVKLNGNDPGRLLQRLEASKDVAKGLATAATLPPGPWLSRRLADLDRLEAETIRAALIAAPLTDPGLQPCRPPAPCVSEVRRLKATAAGVAGEYTRLRLIEMRLNNLPRTPDGAQQSRTTDYVVLRDEAKRLSDLIAARLTEARGAAKADTPKEERPEAKWVSASCIAASKTPRWLYAEGVGAPEYVVVLRRAGAGQGLERLKDGKCELSR